MKTKSLVLETALVMYMAPALMAAAFFALVLAIALPFSWLWNAVPTFVFNAPLLGYWQPVGFLVLITLARAAADGVKPSLKLRNPI